MHACFILGYDSDDEDEDDLRYTRRNKGKKYTQIPKGESMDHSEPSHYIDRDGIHSTPRIDSVSMYGDSNVYAYTQDSHSDRRNSESQCSSEDFCSDSESLTKHAYIQKPREGGRLFTNRIVISSVSNFSTFFQ